MNPAFALPNMTVAPVRYDFGNAAKVKATASGSDCSSKNSGPRIVTRGNGNYYDALCTNEDRSQIPYMRNLRPGMLLTDGLNRRQLAALAQFLVDNGGQPSYAINLIADYSTPVLPQASSDDDDWNKEAEEQFKAWGKTSDYTGRYDFNTQQRLVSKMIDTHGDIGGGMTLKTGAMKLRLYDTFSIGTISGIDKYDGVNLDNDGVVTGYKVCEGLWPNVKERTLSPNEMKLLYDPELLRNYRGYSPMRKGSNDIRDSVDIKAFVKLKEKLAAALPAFIKGGSVIEENVWGDDGDGEDGGNAPSADGTAQEKRIALAELLGGDIPVIDGDLQQFQVSSSATALTVMDVLAGSFVSGLDLPPAYFLDEKLTGPNTRGVLGKAQKKFNRRKMILASLVEFVWQRVIGWKISTGQLRAVPNWWKIDFQFPAMTLIDLGDQMSNEREDVLHGQMSRQERYGNRGMDWMRQEDQISAEQRYIIESCQKMATKLNIPLELVLEARGFTGMATKPKESNQNNPAKEKQA